MDPSMMAQGMGQAPFYYPQNRQHGHFTQQQAMQHMQMYPVVPTLPSTPIYSRPNSSCAQPVAAPTLYSNVAAAMTPMASPQPINHKPTIMLETELAENGMYYPSTPPLSTSGSVISSPNSCDMLQTPMNPMFSGLDGLEGVKEIYEPTENLALDWSSYGSPPMTPGKSSNIEQFFFICLVL
jgi:C2H2 transcription facotor